MVNLDGRVAVVTGAGDGLGKSHALLLASLGARVIVNDLGVDRTGTGYSEQVSDRVVEEIRGAGSEAVANYSDISEERGAQELVDQAIESYGRLDIVVNNAGILQDTSFKNMTVKQWDAVLKVHLQGSFLVTHCAWPKLREQNFGRVIFTTSGAGTFGNFGQANYAAAKMGIIGLMNTLAIEGRQRNILLNAVSPIASTRLTKDVMPQEQLEKLDPAYVSSAVAWLASEDCDITGEVFRVGGGDYQRLQYFVSKGVTFDHIPSVDEFADRIDEIRDMANAVLPTLALPSR